MIIIITPAIVEEIIRSGPLTQAMTRALNGSAAPSNRIESTISNWSLICEEMLDTEHGPNWYDDVLAELGRRGLNFDQINRMRRFAWRTAGWLNYDKMLWDWVSLDESDIRRALDWQLKDGEISHEQFAKDMAIVSDPNLLDNG